MANTIKHKRGTSDPSASDLVVGELAIRTDTGVVFTKKDDGSVAAHLSHASPTTVMGTVGTCCGASMAPLWSGSLAGGGSSSSSSDSDT